MTAEEKVKRVLEAIDAFQTDEKLRGEEEKRGLRRRDGGPTMAAFTLIDQIKDFLQK